MMMFKFPLGRPDSETMRDAAKSVGVSWDEQSIIYQGDCIGYQNCPSDFDPAPLQDELESLVGVRPSTE
jgi:hypothetical protein